MFKKLFVLGLLVASLFGEVRELTDENFGRATSIIFYDEGEEVKRLQGDMSFTLNVTTKELDEIIEEILGSKF